MQPIIVLGWDPFQPCWCENCLEAAIRESVLRDKWDKINNLLEAAKAAGKERDG